jgi:hypothetical protein
MPIHSLDNGSTSVSDVVVGLIVAILVLVCLLGFKGDASAVADLDTMYNALRGESC